MRCTAGARLGYVADAVPGWSSPGVPRAFWGATVRVAGTVRSAVCRLGDKMRILPACFPPPPVPHCTWVMLSATGGAAGPAKDQWLVRMGGDEMKKESIVILTAIVLLLLCILVTRMDVSRPTKNLIYFLDFIVGTGALFLPWCVTSNQESKDKGKADEPRNDNQKK